MADRYYLKYELIKKPVPFEPQPVKGVNSDKDEFLPKVETYYESEEYYKKIDEIITKYPLLNADYIVTYFDTKFIQ